MPLSITDCFAVKDFVYNVNMLSKLKVAVLRGGPSPEYDVSLQTGGHVLSLLREMPEKYHPIDIFISKEGEWHRSGITHEPHEALKHVDMVWNAMHGAYGEDGQVQRILEGIRVPFTGSSSMASALAMNKDMAKGVYALHSLLTPKFEVFEESENIDDKLIFVFRNYLHPVVVKPASSGSSIGVRIAHTFNELKDAVISAFKYSKRVLVEEFIRGKDATCSVIEGARGEKIYALMPDGVLAAETKKEIENLSKLAHQVLGLRHYSSSDFIVTPRGKIYLIETNAQPKFNAGSHLHRSLTALGWRARDFVDHILSLHHH